MLTSVYIKPLTMRAIWVDALHLMSRQWLKIVAIFIIFYGVVFGGWYCAYQYVLHGQVLNGAVLKSTVEQMQVVVPPKTHQVASHAGTSALPKAPLVSPHGKLGHHRWPQGESLKGAHPAVHMDSSQLADFGLALSALPFVKTMIALYIGLLVLTNAACVVAVRSVLDVCFRDLAKQKYSLWQSLVHVFRHLHWLVLYAVVKVVVVGIGMIFLAIPGVIFALMLPFGDYFILYDQAGPFEAFNRAIALVWGHWWRTFFLGLVPLILIGIYMRIAIGSDVIGLLINALYGFGSTELTCRLVAICVGAIFYVCYAYCLMSCVFQDLLKRKELSGASGT